MDQILGRGATGVTESALVFLFVIIVAILVIAVLFSVYAVALRISGARRERLRVALKNQWEGPVLAAIADPGRADEVHALVPRKYRLNFVQFVLEYARRVRGEEQRTLRKLVAPYLDSIAERTKHPRSEVRTRAVQTLGTLGMPRYSAEVLAGLDDPSPLVSMVAARYLARPEHSELAPALMKHLDRFHGWDRRFLASMVATMGPEASPVLRDGVVDESIPEWLRAVYAEALRMQRDVRSADLALQALEDAGGRELIASLLRLIAEVGRPEHVPTLRVWCSSEDELIRAQALHALGVLGDESELPLLLAGMEDASPWAALHAARGVRDAGGRERLEEVAASDHVHASLAGQVLFEEKES